MAASSGFADSTRVLEGFSDLGGAGHIRLRIAAGFFHQPEHHVGQGTRVIIGDDVADAVLQRIIRIGISHAVEQIALLFGPLRTHLQFQGLDGIILYPAEQPRPV